MPVHVEGGARAPSYDWPERRPLSTLKLVPFTPLHAVEYPAPEAPRITVWPARRRPFFDRAKRGMDIVLSLLALLMALPLLVVVAVAIKLDSHGPVFYRQTRLGRDARPFEMLKFRSMYTRDVDLPPDLLARNESSGPLFKLKHDPRVTRVGRIIRKTSLDELPQLLNVLRGEMSLVGPRPPLPRELPGYELAQRLRLRVLPGITGAWQIGGRSRLTFDEMVHLDLQYIENRSLLRDLKILLLTVPAVLFGEGAY